MKGPHCHINFCSVEDHLKRMRRKATDQENTFASHIPKKGLVSRIHKLSKLNSWEKNNNNPIIKWAKNMSRHFIEEVIRMINKHMKRYSTSLVIRDM